MFNDLRALFRFFHRGTDFRPNRSTGVAGLNGFDRLKWIRSHLSVRIHRGRHGGRVLDSFRRPDGKESILGAEPNGREEAVWSPGRRKAIEPCNGRSRNDGRCRYGRHEENEGLPISPDKPPILVGVPNLIFVSNNL